MKQIPRVKRKKKTKVDDSGYFGPYGKKEAVKNTKKSKRSGTMTSVEILN